MDFATLPQEVKHANALLIDTEEKVKVYRLKIKELLSSPQYLGAQKILIEQGADLRKNLAEDIAQKMTLLKTLKPKSNGNGQKAPYDFKIDGQNVSIWNKKNAQKTLKMPLSEVGYNTALIGNDKGATGKIAQIDLTFQQGKSLVKAIKG